ncbi:UDP-N-acetylmuramoyl-L-alanyl-D-glutamate--2,6-diaminopimelate ligase [Rheinheimera maricola]|uniref:UDP-N-acetylmuramoyl-L-alanyl-D-glutamate--2,6-diaminopimelate ligase n=1 Tax=Rheinheimera maricola TaxID=2793282 RepID=A0ABS7X9G7_9GAMM|nr:UDP-N-acetylmuramoyl-L-alanyl-D-glutamate--2,6-diaminopimelate ligase [Rheinheimera maricola]MBZ9611368.1 UDP-N-acetylmuramoyl-L-alanyl-D-glutamate--2,6-diaminopimelate ligase [Rheinheimera maricola]
MPVNVKHWLGRHGINAADLVVEQLQLDSRKVGTGDVFLAIAGVQQHGGQFIAQAIEQGAALVLTDQGNYHDSRVLVLPQLTQQLPKLVADFYGQPATKLKSIGITGTNGKSSIAFFINQLAELLSIDAAVIGTLGYGYYQKLTELPNTTPHFVELQRILAGFVKQQVQLVAMEVSSHALVQQRVDGLQFDVAVFTNLTRDHLDYHGSMAAYGAAKALLFEKNKSNSAVVNVSDEFGRSLAQGCISPLRVYGTAAACVGFERFLAYSDVIALPDGCRFRLSSEQGDFSLRLPLFGEFNIQNVLAAIAALHQLGYPLPELIKAATGLTAVPGRMEQFVFPHHVVAVVDYAHTPDALQQALQALRAHCDGHLWCVFGCGGDRDKGKRPLMGQLAELYADHIIITADNPRSEDVIAICDDIAAGMSPDGNYSIEPDRKTAIKLALVSAQDGDIVLVAGKGHETIQIVGAEQRQYDERGYMRQLVAEMSI